MKEYNRYRNRGRRSKKLLLLLAGVGAAGFASTVAMAQTGPVYNIGETEPEGDVISLTAGLGITRDSNVLRISDEADPRPYGSDSRSDTILNGRLGIAFDRRISQQRLQASAQVQGFKYNEFDDFDNIGYDAGLNYDWVIGRPFFGRVGGRVYRYQPAIQDRNIGQTVVERNEVERQTVYVNGGVRFTPSWSAIAGWDLDRRRNTSSLYEDSDADYNSVEAGARFAPGTGLEVDFVYRRTDGDYKQLQVNGPDGLPLLGGPRSSDFKQDAILARISYRPTEDSRIAGRIGYTDRSYDVDSSRDFSGITTGFDIEWAQSGAVRWLVSFARDIEPDDSAITATYADARSFAIRPTIQATGKITVMPFFQYVDRKFKGEGGSNDRKEDFQAFGVTVDYEIRRNLNALLDLRREQRNSNIDYLDFDANIVSLGLQVRF
jgi:exopolysaccharide biosynthesis operon protein EpsL